jgi:hypothetical protein
MMRWSGIVRRSRSRLPVGGPIKRMISALSSRKTVRWCGNSWAMTASKAKRRIGNWFQPSLKLKEKRRTDHTVQRVYEVAQTPFERASAAAILTSERQTQLDTMFTTLDPVRLLTQIDQLQHALWQHAVVGTRASDESSEPSTLRFTASASSRSEQAAPDEKRVYRRKRVAIPRWWRTRVDPFAEVWTEIEQWLEANPTRTAKSIFQLLHQRDPERYPHAQLRTLQRRIAKWRATMSTMFDDQWLQDELLAAITLPRPLQAVKRPDDAADPPTG